MSQYTRQQHSSGVSRGEHNITLRYPGLLATRELLLREIRAQDALMRRWGCDPMQRGYLHSAVRLKMLQDCRTAGDRRLVLEAFAQAENEGVVPSMDEIWEHVNKPGYRAPHIDTHAMAQASERLTQTLACAHATTAPKPNRAGRQGRRMSRTTIPVD